MQDRVAWLIALQRSMARVFTQNLPRSAMIAQILSAIAEASRSDAALLWSRNGTSDDLTAECTWCSKPESARLLAPFEGNGIRGAIGLGERVLASGEPIWFDNALRSGEPGSVPLLGSAFAFPVCAGGEIAAVAGFLRRERHPPVPDLLPLLEPIGLQFGTFLGNSRMIEKAALWSVVFRAGSDAMVCVDPDEQISDWNPAAERLFGYSRSEVLRKSLSETIVPGRLREKHLRGFSGLRPDTDSNSAVRLETWARRADGSEIPVEITIFEISPEAGFVAAVRDLSDRRRGVAELEQLMAAARIARSEAESARNLLNEVFAKSPYLVLVTEGPEHRVRFATNSAIDVFRPRPDVLGQQLADAYPEFALLGYVQLFSQVYRFGETVSGREIPLTNAAWRNTVRYFDYTFQPLRDKSDAITGVAAHGIEVTDKVVARQHLEQALRARDDFVSVAAHELRNPLNVLQLQIASTALKLKPEGSPIDGATMRERLERMSQTVGVLSGLVERLLDVSRMASGPLRLEPEEFELGSLIREIVDRMAVDGGRETYIHQPAELSVTWDRQRIDRLISNLLGNAYTYAAGQPVSVRLQAVDGGAVRIEVRDRGPGIPAEDQARIFGLFEQSQPRGALSGFGFGLWVSRQIVEAHGGRIWVESTLGNGACFVAEMPSRLTLSHGS